MSKKERIVTDRIRFQTVIVTAALGTLAGALPASAQWRQWGGPNRNFAIKTDSLADRWPDEGPKQLWKRQLGDGYATIVAEDGLLFTMYRQDKTEFTVALDARTGKTVWEHANPSPFTEVMAEFGPGPHSTPLILGNRLFTIGTNMVMHCFNKKTGEVLWKHDLANEFDAPIPNRGYASSPIAYKNTVIVPVDRKREESSEEPPADAEEKENAEQEVPPADPQSLVAFDMDSGSVVWKNQDFEITPSSPLVINFDGKDQLVYFTAKSLVGLDPTDGTLLWEHPYGTQYGANISTPLWNGKDLLFASAAYGAGSRAIRLKKEGGKIVPEEVWYTRKMRVHHGNVVQVGEYVYGSSGDFGPALFMGVHLPSGKIAWRERGFKKATCVYGDGKVIILDEDGYLALATVSPDGLTIHSKCKVSEPYSWAAPTLVGTTLFVRDREHIMAFDLG